MRCHLGWTVLGLRMWRPVKSVAWRDVFERTLCSDGKARVIPRAVHGRYAGALGHAMEIQTCCEAPR